MKITNKIVYACFGENSSHRDLLRELTNFEDDDILIIDTKNTKLNGEHINKYNDFSAYCEGLKRIYEFNELNGNIESHFNIIFMNDTFFNGHTKAYRNFYLKRLINLALSDKVFSNSLLGHIKKFGDLEYISSWLFMLSCDSEKLQRIKLVEEENKFSNVDYLDSAEYKTNLAMIDAWIKPNKFLRGWQGHHGIKMSTEMYEKKKFLVFNEITLPRRLNACGVRLVELESKKKIHKLILQKLDVLHHNLKKVKKLITTKSEK